MKIRPFNHIQSLFFLVHTSWSNLRILTQVALPQICCTLPKKLKNKTNKQTKMVHQCHIDRTKTQVWHDRGIKGEEFVCVIKEQQCHLQVTFTDELPLRFSHFKQWNFQQSKTRTLCGGQRSCRDWPRWPHGLWDYKTVSSRSGTARSHQAHTTDWLTAAIATRAYSSWSCLLNFRDLGVLFCFFFAIFWLQCSENTHTHRHALSLKM